MVKVDEHYDNPISKRKTFLVLLALTLAAVSSIFAYQQDPTWRTKSGIRKYGMQFDSPKTFAKKDGSSLAQDSSLRPIGRWGYGPCYAVAADSEFVLAGNGSLLQVLAWDSSSKSVSVLSQIDLGVTTFQIRIRDTLVFIVGGSVFDIIECKDPHNLRLLGSLQIPDIFLTLEIEDSTAYATTWFGELALIDIRDVSSPRLISSVVTVTERTATLAVKNGYCYVGGQDTPLLYIYDARRSDSVVSIGFANTYGLPDYALVRDTILILGALSTHTIQFLSVANPENPVYLYDLGLPGIDTFSINDLKVFNSHLYVSTDRAGLFDINLADSAMPFIALHREFPYVTSSGGSAVMVQGVTLMTACDNGIAIYDAADSLRYIGFFPTGGAISKINISRNIAAVASTTGGLWLLDISDPSKPIQISNINNGGYTFTALISQNTMIMYDQPDHVFIYDISDSAHPSLLGTFMPPPLSSEAQDGVAMCSDGNLLFLAQEQSFSPPQTDLEVVDISDPRHPTQLKSISIPASIVRMTSASGALYTATREKGVCVFDYESVPDFHKVDSIRSGSFILSLAIQDSSLFLLSGSDIVEYDIGQPFAPESVSAIEVNPYYPFDIAAADNYVYSSITDSTPGIAGIDVSDDHHLIKGVFTPSDNVSALAASKGSIYVAITEVGISVYRNDLVVGVKSLGDRKWPASFRLDQNYPNPFNPATTITYAIPSRSVVILKIYDILGREVRVLTNEIESEGTHSTRWEANELAGGTYFCKLSVIPLDQKRRPFTAVRKMMVIR